MVIQLGFVGIYLGYIFKLNNHLINVFWIFIMMVVANHAILKQSGLKWRFFFFHTIPALLIGMSVNFLSLLILFDPQTLLSSRYFIPIGGMVMGNILRGNIISLDRFYHSLFSRMDEYVYYIGLGATRNEALKPFMAESMRSAISPYIATMATIGLVSLPGMMTGQILGGASPIVAIQYQILIMISIFFTSSISMFLGIFFSIRVAFDPFHRLQERLFTRKNTSG
jgi:putative ABC transport system permease protein